MNLNRVLMVFALASGVAWTAVGQADDEGWSGEVNLAVSSGTGTTNTFSGNLDAKSERTWENDIVTGRFTGTLGTTEEKNQREQTTQNAQAILGDWNHTIHERFFWTSGTEFSRDVIQDRDLRARVESGPGFRLWQEGDDKKQHFDITLGFGYRYEIYDGNTGGAVSENGDTDHLADAIASFEYKHLLFDGKIDFTHTGKASLPVNDPNAYLLETEAIARVPLSEAWSFRVSALVQYANSVPAEIEKLATTTTVGLGYKF